MNLNELINKANDITAKRKYDVKRKKELEEKFECLKEELKEVEYNCTYAMDDGIYDIGKRALLENCNNCALFIDQKENLEKCNKCRYNYDSYFEEIKDSS